MKKLILFAVVISIITGFAVYNYANSLESRYAVKTEAVVVALKNIPKNTIIKSEMIEIRNLPIEAVHSLALNAIDEIRGRIAKEDIMAEEQILSTRLSDFDKNNDSLSYSITKNYRAISIKTDEITGVAGYINIGDRIDVIADMIIESGTTKKIISQMIVENIEVVEVGVKSSEKSKSIEQYTSITVLVPAKDVLKLNYALYEGKYNIALRPIVAENILNPAPYYP